MKSIVRVIPWEGFLLGVAGLLLLVVIQQETAISYVVAVGLAMITIGQHWARRRREKAQDTPRRQS